WGAVSVAEPSPSKPVPISGHHAVREHEPVVEREFVWSRAGAFFQVPPPEIARRLHGAGTGSAAAIPVSDGRPVGNATVPEVVVGASGAGPVLQQPARLGPVE